MEAIIKDNTSFHVFLSFNQEDTVVKNFTDFLYADLNRKGFRAFKNEIFKKGDIMRSESLKALKESRISVIIFSKMYASSAECLDELEEMMEFSHVVVLPVFYDITPLEVKQQTGLFEAAFSRHQEAAFGDNKVEQWRNALTQAANLCGFTFQQFDGYERKLIDAIVEEITSKLSPSASTDQFIREAETERDQMDQVVHNDLTYDAFLSFDQEDTSIKNFTGYLNDALNQKGFRTFNYEMLKKGKKKKSEILNAINDSKISIIIFSKNFASSVDCLDEFEEIMENCQVFLPVFFDITPSNVRKQTGSLESFFRNQAAFQDNKVQKWRNALTQAADTSGFTLQGPDRQRELIGAIVKYITTELSPILRSNACTKGKIGLDSRLEELKMKMDFRSDDVRFIGIHGMGGIGKTTLARAFCEQMSGHFDATCFLKKVRDASTDGGVSFQEQLLSQILNENGNKIWNTYDGVDLISRRLRNKKVLIAIDDVDHISQVMNLTGHHKWFGKGSRILVTTRDEHLLAAIRVDDVYKAKLLSPDEALKLLCLKAFKSDSVPDDKYQQLCMSVVKSVKGLPLALEVLGSFLCNRRVGEWESALERLKNNPHKDILDCLQISFDSLQETEKKIFIDIAFFFKGMHKDNDHVIEILESCDLYPGIGLQVLIEKSLISLSYDNRLLMHDLLVDMAKKVVEIESSNDVGKRSWLCQEIEVHDVLMNKMGTEAIRGITHNFLIGNEVSLLGTAFENLKNLTVLKISNVKLLHGLHYLPNQLRLLEWRGYPATCLPLGFEPHGIVILKLPRSRIQHLWKGLKVLGKLKVIDLSYSEDLIETPNLEGVPNLEILSLKFCKELSKVDPSLGFLKKLKTLSLNHCVNLSFLPSFVSLDSLEVCDLQGCPKLVSLPVIKGRMDSLLKLELFGTGIENYSPFFFRLVKNLLELSFGGSISDYRSRNFMLSSLRDLQSLKNLSLSFCKLDEGGFPNALLGHLSSLTLLNLSGDDFVKLPAFICQLPSLNCICLSNCGRLRSISELPPSVETVVVVSCPALKEWFTHLYLQEFDLSFCMEDFSMESEMTDAPHFMVYESTMNYRYRGYNYMLIHQTLTKRYQLYAASEIPAYYRYQMEGDSIDIESHTFSDTGNRKLVGLFACCFISFDEDILAFPALPVGSFYYGPCSLSLRLYVDNNIALQVSIGLFAAEEAIRNDYLWVVSIPEYQKYFGSKIKIEFVASTQSDYQWSGPVVKRSGARLVYQSDFLEPNTDRAKQDNKPNTLLYPYLIPEISAAQGFNRVKTSRKEPEFVIKKQFAASTSGASSSRTSESSTTGGSFSLYHVSSPSNSEYVELKVVQIIEELDKLVMEEIALNHKLAGITKRRSHLEEELKYWLG